VDAVIDGLTFPYDLVTDFDQLPTPMRLVAADTRKAEVVVGDTGGNPAGTKTKTQELVERDNVDMILGPLAAFELLAISDYAAQAKMPILSLAAAEDMTQRKPNPYFVRASATSAQGMHPLADYAAEHPQWAAAVKMLPDGKQSPRLASWRVVRTMLGDGFGDMFDTIRHPDLTEGQVPLILRQMDTVTDLEQ